MITVPRVGTNYCVREMRHFSRPPHQPGSSLHIDGRQRCGRKAAPSVADSVAVAIHKLLDMLFECTAEACLRLPPGIVGRPLPAGRLAVADRPPGRSLAGPAQVGGAGRPAGVHTHLVTRPLRGIGRSRPARRPAGWPAPADRATGQPAVAGRQAGRACARRWPSPAGRLAGRACTHRPPGGPCGWWWAGCKS